MNDLSLPAAGGLPIAASGLNFPVVGLGASAGGLAALIRFFEQMPGDPGMAFVVILHLSPKHESNVAAILQNVTKMPVTQVIAATPIERNHVYVIPPTHSLSMYDGHLSLSQPDRSRIRHVAIDLFFRTLAEAHGARAVGIVLSGTGADGSVGIARIKELCGVVIAQSPADAEFSGMPDSAIATGKVDIVLPVAEMPQKLIELWKNAQGIELPTPETAGIAVLPPASPEKAEDALHAIMALLHRRTGHDFKHYKRATVLRRVERRLQVNGLPHLPAYLAYLTQNEHEAPALLNDMLIGVTNFFRDRESFEALERDVIPALFNSEGLQGEQLRAWVPACSTGEEAYSLAILLMDAATRARNPREIQIFASDIDEAGLATGRQATYTQSIVTDVTPGFLRTYFIKEGGGYQVQEVVRKKILFAMHNILRDPPFSRLDLVSCRNLLIYLDRDVQKEILQMFHFSLRPGGYLFLGESETADAAPKLFTIVDKKHRIYRSNPSMRTMRSLPHFPLGGPDHKLSAPTPVVLSPKGPKGVGQLHKDLLLKDYTPASVVVNQDATIVHTSGGAGRFLGFGEGDPSHHLLTLVQPELRPELRSALFQSAQSNATVEAAAVRIVRNGRYFNVHMIVRPLNGGDWPPQLSMVLFAETEEPAGTEDAEIAAAAGNPTAHLLEEELQRKGEQLQSTIEQYEASCEDLKASNEELQAINEELRSASEELETSKEELQSTNEELITVNHELKSKVEETAQINDDLQNLIASTEIATVFVDPQMRIKRFTPASASIFNIIESDVGRSLLDITHKLEYDNLAGDAAATFASLRMVEREVRSSDDRWFLARLLPYRTGENLISGAVLTFVDISSRLLAERRMHMGEERMRLVAQSMPDFAILTLDTEGKVTSWSTGAERLFGYGEAEVLGQPGDLLFTPEDRAQGVPEGEMRRAREAGKALDERWHIRKDGSRFFASGIMTPLRQGGLRGYAKIARDMTARHQEAGAGAAAREAAEISVKLKDEFLAVMSHELKNPLNLIHVNTQLLLNLPQAMEIPLVKKASETIERGVAAQAKIVDDLLDLSRTQSGKLRLDIAPVDLLVATEPCLKWVSAQAAQKGVRVELAGFDSPVVVQGDVVRIEQIAWNLLSNAIKFTSSGGTIRVKLSQQNGEACFEVTDNGRGIAPAFLPHVFNMFQQEDSSRTRQEGGLGIGLGLVHALVALHNGRIVALSPGTGRGATFRVHLPLAVRSDVENQIDAGDVSQSLAGLRLLVVDDMADALETFGMILELCGAKVVCASSGFEALALCEESTFDLIVSDIGMPGMNGIELIAQLRRKPSTALTPAIALTGYGRPQDVQEAMAAGFSGHLVKPAGLDDVRRTILRLTGKKQ